MNAVLPKPPKPTYDKPEDWALSPKERDQQTVRRIQHYQEIQGRKPKMEKQ